MLVYLAGYLTINPINICMCVFLILTHQNVDEEKTIAYTRLFLGNSVIAGRSAGVMPT